jgi:pimeloyl-ACP methyl ester carboxylesterase
MKGLRVRCLTADAGGPSVLLLHGSGIGSAGFSYKPVIELLAFNHGVFALDWPGFGESDKPEVEHTMGSMSATWEAWSMHCDWNVPAS